ncbi:MAG: ABC-F family ATP-binding cassette domain-containing protein [Deltaproteobacteria bacterium]|nr:ABC-F family ATP-binding cassette domain-containing protein [Deltaproteobacteria bacterium]MBW2537796.1 ABC-F family ATP-binding cassette domain-containing protein [Deltaproteobacteria bacterium]
MIGITNLSKNFGEQTLFEDVTVQLNPACCCGVVGANGSDKSTFLKILTGDEYSSDGEITFPKAARIGVLRQDRFQSDDQIILDVAMMGDEEDWNALREQDWKRSTRTAAFGPRLSRSKSYARRGCHGAIDRPRGDRESADLADRSHPGRRRRSGQPHRALRRLPPRRDPRRRHRCARSGVGASLDPRPRAHRRGGRPSAAPAAAMSSSRQRTPATGGFALPSRSIHGRGARPHRRSTPSALTDVPCAPLLRGTQADLAGRKCFELPTRQR